MAEPELSADLTKKMGPLPVWAWALLVGGGIGFYLYVKRTKSGTVNTADSTAAAAGTGFGTTNPGAGNVSASSGGTDTSVTPTGVILTNQQWSVKAQSMLIAFGYDPATVSAALANYLGGNDLTAQQNAIVNEALRAAGPTPESVPPAVTQQPAPTPILPGGSTTANPTWDSWVGSAPIENANQYDWGQLARLTLSGSPTKSDVFYRSIALQQKYPDLAKQYPQYVPGTVARTITYP